MKATKQGGFVTVTITGADTNSFRAQWPCCEIPEDAAFMVELDARNGDLVNLTAWQDDAGLWGNGGRIETEPFDGPALLALTNGANNFAVHAGMLPQWAKR